MKEVGICLLFNANCALIVQIALSQKSPSSENARLVYDYRVRARIQAEKTPCRGREILFSGNAIDSLASEGEGKGGKMAASLWLIHRCRGTINRLLGRNLMRAPLGSLSQAVGCKFLHTTPQALGEHLTIPGKIAVLAVCC